jgi:hypothetical protein
LTVSAPAPQPATAVRTQKISTPSQMAPTTRKHQTPRLPNAEQIKSNLPNTGNFVSTGFSPEYRLST